jgi:hypothetical protein
MIGHINLMIATWSAQQFSRRDILAPSHMNSRPNDVAHILHRAGFAVLNVKRDFFG